MNGAVAPECRTGSASRLVGDDFDENALLDRWSLGAAVVAAAGGVLALHYPEYLPVGMLGSPVAASSPTPQVAMRRRRRNPRRRRRPHLPKRHPAGPRLTSFGSNRAATPWSQVTRPRRRMSNCATTGGRSRKSTPTPPGNSSSSRRRSGQARTICNWRFAAPTLAPASDAVPVEVATQKVAAAAVTPPAPQPQLRRPPRQPPRRRRRPRAVLASVQTPPARHWRLPGPVGTMSLSRRSRRRKRAGLQVKGSAEANATVRLYLNGSFVADASAGADRQWSLTIEHGMAPGLYTMRADEIDRADGRVLARAEAPFAYPLHPTAAGPSLASDGGATPREPSRRPLSPRPFRRHPSPASTPVVHADGPSDKPPAHVVVAEVQTTTVVRGDNLWDLARRYYGDGMQFRQIYEANSSQIRGSQPDLCRADLCGSQASVAFQLTPGDVVIASTARRGNPRR